MKTIHLLYGDFAKERHFTRAPADHPYFSLDNGRTTIQGDRMWVAKIRGEVAGTVDGVAVPPAEILMVALSDHQLDETERQGVIQAATMWAIEQGLARPLDS